MSNKKHIIVFLIVALMALMVSAVSAAESNQQGPGGPGGPGADRPGRPDRPRGDGELLQLILDETGLTIAEIREQVSEGATLAEVITANDGDIQTVIDAAVAKITERINAAVDEGRITQEQADARLTDLEANITERLNAERPLWEGRPDRGDRRERLANLLDGVIHEYLTEAGVTGEVIREGRQAGLTFAETLTEAGVNVDEFVSVVSTQAETVLSEAVENERITQEQADTMLEIFTQRLTDRINGERPGSADSEGI